MKGKNKWIALINIPIQMGVCVYLFVLLGNYLDGRFNEGERFYIKITTVVGVAIALYLVNRQVQEINKEK